MSHILAAILGFFLAFIPNHYERTMDHVSDSIVRVTGTITLQMYMEQSANYPIFVPDQSAQYSCTGFVIGQDLVLTAGHCFGDAMTADGATATMIKRDKYYDLMLLKVKTPRKALVVRDLPVERGEHATGIGYGFGWTKLTLKQGRVMLTNYNGGYPDMAVGTWVETGWIGGMSGGPIVDDSGLVVGVVQRSNGAIGYGVGSLLIRAFLLGT